MSLLVYVLHCFHAHRVRQMAQPAIIRDDIGRGSHEIVQQVAGCKLRLTKFVECQAPMFYRSGLLLWWEWCNGIEVSTGLSLQRSVEACAGFVREAAASLWVWHGYRVDACC
jgi:hypothetical protein